MRCDPHGAGELQLLAEQLARRILPQARTLVVSRVQSGISTWVYRIDQDGTTFYLRILPEENASFAPEVYVHSLLLARKLHVPEIVYYEPYNEAFQRSVVLTTAIVGTPIADNASPEAMAPVLRHAGRELALINQVPVDGFGWVQRSSPKPDEVRGEYATFAAWMQQEVEQSLSNLAHRELFPAPELVRLEKLATQAIEVFASESSRLAHGDFDSTHLFQIDHEYTGIIDFGEIRGANLLYDLGHFAIENPHFLPALLQGYRTVALLPLEYEEQISQMSLLIALNRSGRRAARHADLLTADRQVFAHLSPR